MLENGKISSSQLMILVVLVTIGDSILVLPAISAAEAKQDAWISAIFSVGIGLLVLFLFLALSRRFPNYTLIEMSEKIFGKWIGMFVSFLYVSYFLLDAGAYLREIGDFYTTQMLPQTPIQSILILFMGIVLMGARLGLEPLARSAEILFPLFILFLLPIIVFLLPVAQIENLQPILEDGFIPIIRGSFTIIAYPFLELVIFLMVLPYVSQKEQMKKSLILGVMFGGLVITLITTISILVLGHDQTSRETYPIYLLAKKINIADFFTRVEASLTISWMISIFYKLSLLFYAAGLGLAQTLKLKEHLSLLFPLAIIVIVLSMIIAPNISYYNNVITHYWPFYDVTICFLIPLFMLIVTKIKTRITKKQDVK